MTFSDDIFQQNDWANLKLLGFCRDLPGEALDTEAEGNYGSVRATLLHIARAQERYVARLSSGTIDGVLPESEGFPGFDKLEESLTSSGPQLRQIASELDTEEIRELESSFGKYRIHMGTILVQAINHATEHRTQIKTILSTLGHEPPDLDSWTWASEVGKLQEI